MLRIVPLVMAASFALGQAQTARPIKWACIGNSITSGFNGSTGYPALLATKLGPAFQVENDGVSGGYFLSVISPEGHAAKRFRLKNGTQRGE